MEFGHWSLHIGKEPAEKKEDHSCGQSADLSKCNGAASPRGSELFSIDLLRQRSRSFSQSPSTEASLGDEATSETSSREWSREDGLHDLSSPVFIVKNTFIHEVMAPEINSRVRSSSAPPSPCHGTETGECVDASATGMVCVDNMEGVVFPSQSTKMSAESLALGTAPFPLPRTAAPTSEPARLPLISVGAEVEIESSSTAPELHGLIGTVQGWEAQTGHYDVILRGSTSGDKSRLAKVKPENIRRSDPPPPAFDVSSHASTQIPGPARWGASVRRGEFPNSSEIGPLISGTHFQHHPYYDDTLASGAVFPIIPMPFDASNHSHYTTGVFPWLPEAR